MVLKLREKLHRLELQYGGGYDEESSNSELVEVRRLTEQLSSKVEALVQNMPGDLRQVMLSAPGGVLGNGTSSWSNCNATFRSRDCSF